MFNVNDTSNLDAAIDSLLEQMSTVDGDTESYANMADQLMKLHQMKDLKKSSRVSPDTLALIAGNLFGIAMIVGHERAHVVTSKAIGFVSKLK